MINWLKRMRQWCQSIVTINKRLKTLENIHFGDESHPGDICPQCGKHTVHHEIRRCDERCISNNHYVHKQTDWEVCTVCPYEKGGEAVECHTEFPVTETPGKTDWEAAMRHMTRL